MFESARLYEKSAKVAEKHRKLGCQHFSKKENFDALIEFNKSLCHAFPGSVPMALTYANRAEVYFQLKLYEHCLGNIELSLDNGYPRSNMERLLSCRKRCKQLMRDDCKQHSPWDIFKLSYDRHQHVPFLSNCLNVRNVPGVGQRFAVNQDLKSGDFIAIVDGASKLINPLARHLRCSWCLRDAKLDLLPCRGCPMAMFCSKECMTNVTHHHARECSNKDSLFGRVMSRATALFGSSDKFKEFTLGELRKFPTKSMNFFSYNWNLIEPRKQEKLLFVISFVNSNQKNRSVEDIFGEMQQIESVNSRMISLVDEDAGHNGREICKSVHSTCIGLVMNPLLSFVSVSCHPNAAFMTVDNKIVLMVLRPIKAGGGISVSNDRNSQNSSEEARKLVHQRNSCNPCRFTSPDFHPVEITVPEGDSTDIDSARDRFQLKTRELNRLEGEHNWVLAESLQLDASILAKPAPFYPWLLSLSNFKPI